MFVGIVRSDINKGSSEDLATYLQKEDKERPYSERTHFFNKEQDRIRKSKVVNALDQNKAKLKKKEAKYFMINVAPSPREQAHILKRITGRKVENLNQITPLQRKVYEDKLKSYANNVMVEYAKNFNREGLDDSKLLWYGKVEHTREYKGTDLAVKQGKAKSGQKKEGLNSHIHIIVSRKEKDNGASISPFSRSKGSDKHQLNGKKVAQGFNRKEFINNCESSFDRQFNYDRPLKEHFIVRDAIKQSYQFEKQLNRLMKVVKEHTEDKEVYHATKEGRMVAKKVLRVGVNTGIAYAKGGSKIAGQTLTNSTLSSFKGAAIGQMSKLAMVNPKLMVAVTLVKNSVGILDKVQKFSKTQSHGISR